MNALEKLEADRDAALEALKTASAGIKVLLEEEERFLKANRERRMEIDRQKSVLGKRAQDAQAKLDALDAAIPRDVLTVVSEREAKVAYIEAELRSFERELKTAKYNIESMRKKNVKRDEIIEFINQATQLEGQVEEMASDLEEEKKGLEAARVLKREALEEAAAVADGIVATKP